MRLALRPMRCATLNQKSHKVSLLVSVNSGVRMALLAACNANHMVAAALLVARLLMSHPPAWFLALACRRRSATHIPFSWP